jgi:hypothetical protein
MIELTSELVHRALISGFTLEIPDRRICGAWLFPEVAA